VWARFADSITNHGHVNIRPRSRTVRGDNCPVDEPLWKIGMMA